MANQIKKKTAGSLTIRGKKKHFYLRHYVNGKQEIVKLLNEEGLPITKWADAVKAQERVRAPLGLDSKEEQLESIRATLQGLKRKRTANKPSLPLPEVWTAYEASRNRPRSGKSTLNRYRYTTVHFNNWIKEAHPEIETMRDVTQSIADGYANHMEARRLAPASFNIYLQCLTTIWVVLREQGDVAANPWAWDQKTRTGIQRLNVKEQQAARKRRALSLEEINAVVEASTGDYRTLFVILATTGQRLIDVVHLQWDAIDLKRGVITLIPEKTKRTGKKVFIPILPQLRQTLGAMMPQGRYVMPGMVSQYKTDRSQIARDIRAVFTLAGIEQSKETELKTCVPIKATGAHSFRHSYVTFARAHGIPDRIIRQVTGHASVEMTDGYDNLTADTIADLPIGLPQPTQREPIPAWARELLATATADNWKDTITQILEV